MIYFLHKFDFKCNFIFKTRRHVNVTLPSKRDFMTSGDNQNNELK